LTSSPRPGSPYESALLAVADKDGTLVAAEVGGDRSRASSFAQRYPERFLGLPRDPARVAAAVAERTPSASAVFLRADPVFLLEEAFGPLVRAAVLPRASLKLVAEREEEAGGRTASLLRDGPTVMRSVPGVAVAVPADGPCTEAAVAALAAHQGPAYLELPPSDARPLGGSTFAVGRAGELRAGTDLAIASYGPLLSRAVSLADDLARVGVSARVLDLASLKPIDEPAILRAARDTGAILVAEAAPLATGIGTFVAALTAENHPIPVRRVGLPDTWSGGTSEPALDAAGLSAERLRDEAWELLRLRGKVQ
jgi:transketolase